MDLTDSCFQTHTSSLWQLSFPSFIGSFFSSAPRARKGSNPRPWKRRQVPKFLTTGLGFGNLSTALGYNLGRSSSCQCLFSFSFEDDLITKIGRLLTAPEFYSFFLSFGSQSMNLDIFSTLLSSLLPARARRGNEKGRGVNRWTKIVTAPNQRKKE